MKPYLKKILVFGLFTGLFFSGCLAALKTPLTLPEHDRLIRDQLDIRSDFPLATQHRLFEDLIALRDDLHKRLALRVSNEPIYVYLFQTPRRFNAFMQLHHPTFPQRRAFFLETDTRLEVYAQWGDRVAEDLRHEVTHAYLHSIVPNLPVWLDEGLAEYFEVPRGHFGLQPEHLALLIAGLDSDRYSPNLTRLEQLDPTHDLSLQDYAESWAWIHFLLQSNAENRKLLCNQLQQLREQGTAPPLSVALQSQLEQIDLALIAHLRRLAIVDVRESGELVNP